MNPPHVEFQEVSVIAGDRTILDSMSAVVPEYTVTTVIGPSGSGKTTLLHLVNRLIDPSRGRVFVNRREVREWPVNVLRQYVGIVFQHPIMLPGTVAENLELPGKIHKKKMEPLSRLLDLVELPHSLLGQDADTLSGGQKQRVAIARSLANRPSIMLFDEATSALDPGAAQQMEQLARRLADEHLCTVIWVTHNLEQAERIGDMTWFLDQGRLVEAAPTDELFHHPRSSACKEFLHLHRKEVDP
jgi:putative ABC transport system ATP-binding protein